MQTWTLLSMLAIYSPPANFLRYTHFIEVLLKYVPNLLVNTFMNLRYQQEYSKTVRYLILQITLVSHLETNVVSSTKKCIKILANHDLPKHLKSQHQEMFCWVAGWTSLDLIVPLRQVKGWSTYLLWKLWGFHLRGKLPSKISENHSLSYFVSVFPLLQCFIN